MQEFTRDQLAPVTAVQPPASLRRASPGPIPAGPAQPDWTATLVQRHAAFSGAPMSLAGQHANILADERLRLSANATRREELLAALQQHYGNNHVQRVLAKLRPAFGPPAPVQRQAEADEAAAADEHEPESESNTLSIDEEGITDVAYSAPSFVTGDEKVKGSPDATKDKDLVDVTGKVSANYKASIKVTLPTVPDDLTACQKKRVKDAIDNQLAPHEQEHVKAFQKYDGAYTAPIEVKGVLRPEALKALTAAAKEKADEEGLRRKEEAQQASDALDNPPFVVEVDLNCEDEKKDGDQKPKQEASQPEVSRMARPGASQPNAASASTAADDDLAAELARQSSGGEPLSAPTQARLEAAFGYDLSSVRVHSGPNAEALSEKMEARAFTNANNIWLGQGASASDMSLMAHEVAHAVQQSSGPVAGRPAGGISLSQPGDPFEQAAEQAALDAAAGRPAAPLPSERAASVSDPAAQRLPLLSNAARASLQAVQRDHHAGDTPARRLRAQQVSTALGQRIATLNARAEDLESVGYPEEATLDRMGANRLRRLQTRLDEISRGERNEEPPTVEECLRITEVRLPQESGIMFATESFAVQAGRLINQLDIFITARQNSAAEAETPDQRDYYNQWADRLIVYRERIRDLMSDPPSSVSEQQQLLMNVMVYVNITRPEGGSERIYANEDAPPDEAMAAQIRQTADAILPYIRGLENQARTEPVGPSLKRFQIEYLQRERTRLLGAVSGMQALYSVDVGRLGADYYADSLHYARDRMESYRLRREADPSIIQARLRANLATFRRRTAMVRTLIEAMQRERQRLQDVQFGFRLIQACELLQSAAEIALIAPTRAMNMPDVPSHIISVGGDVAGFAGANTGPLVGTAGGTGASIIQYMLDSGLADRLTQRREALRCLNQADTDIAYCAELAEMNVAATLNELHTLGRQIEEDTERLRVLGAAAPAREGEAAPAP
jgi:hypothetical protein